MGEQKDKAFGSTLDQDALAMHASGRPGKIEIVPTKPLTTQRDLSLAYSPGVAAPCREIARDPNLAYDYTAKGNIVAVISNGTAVLGLGDIGALAGKPVMEGKSVLFKKFADVDSIDLEVDTRDVPEFVNCVRFLSPSFGGINLEDIKAPECFIIEQQLREMMDIPIFHDDQHGTAIIATAGLINACKLTGRDLGDVRVVVNGAGAAGIACSELIKSVGIRHENVTLCDTAGVIYKGRTVGMNQWKSAHAVSTSARTLTDAMEGADVFLGLSVKGVVNSGMLSSMAARPIIFAMANPDPEVTPEEVRAVRTDAIVATGRSDYPNQINNVLGFPYIFRGALDVRAKTINDEMKIACAKALAALAREDVPDEVAAAYSGRRLQFGPDYLIPVPFDPRLISRIPPVVAQAAIDSGVARKPIEDMGVYRQQLAARLNPMAGSLQRIFAEVAATPRRVVFAEGEEEKTIRAAVSFRNSGYGNPILIGHKDRILETMTKLGLDPDSLKGIEIYNAALSERNRYYADYVYSRQQRKGLLWRDCLRLVNRDRNVFGACMVRLGDADAMVTGLTRTHGSVVKGLLKVVDPQPGCRIFGMTIMLSRGRIVFVADTTIHERPTAEELADIALGAAAKVRQMGYEPRVALISYSTFGNPDGPDTRRIKDAVRLLDEKSVDFEYDGDIGANVALDGEFMKLYPFCRLSAPANILVMPGQHSANIAYKMMGKLGGATVIGPVMIGLDAPVQIVHLDAHVSDLVTMAVLAAHESLKY